MPITVMNPAGLPEIDLYRQVSVATGSRQIYVAGQVAWDADGTLVGAGDLAAQVEQVYLNLGTALDQAGATFDDVAKLTAYLVDWTPDKMPDFLAGAARAFAKLGVSPVPPFTGIGVAALAEPGLLVEIEIEAVAVLA
ncbi:Endoribonuclease L-PSP [Kribbella flavida DSM 17836]|uniref:Endoribonuclease L-PSP n=1 Tax=Kribbella flavida (strain DSM 17836 / JCM 10339 / NBRC 14399) TaxID=479435 RepID=D2PTR8_KRIFD|nr:RidA family protein [Kribbella flavida]ADB31381.1 Endoribonuclease L-PSP [Kribbella flavida DSM 17836]